MTLRIYIPCACGLWVEVDTYHAQRVTCAACAKKEKG